MGPHPELIGRRVEQPPGGHRGTGASGAGQRGAPRAVNPRDEVLPTRVTGTLAGVGQGESRDLAVAVDGRLYATGRTFHLRGRTFEYFSMLLPEEALHPGDNRLEIFEVGAGDRLTPLYRSGPGRWPGSTGPAGSAGGARVA